MAEHLRRQRQHAVADHEHVDVTDFQGIARGNKLIECGCDRSSGVFQAEHEAISTKVGWRANRQAGLAGISGPGLRAAQGKALPGQQCPAAQHRVVRLKATSTNCRGPGA
ncbi:hypothetical protein CEJ63_26000, partial [Acinetobacter baumannii]